MYHELSGIVVIKIKFVGVFAGENIEARIKPMTPRWMLSETIINSSRSWNRITDTHTHTQI